jgi:hypothetical protein
MIGAFEQFHGAVLRELIVSAPGPVTLQAKDCWGRVNSFAVNDAVGLHIKHSAKRLPPWQFTFNSENVSELELLGDEFERVWIALVCGQDGIVALTLDAFRSVNPRHCETTCFIRIDRDRRSMYRVNGTKGALAYKAPRGLDALVADISRHGIAA